MTTVREALSISKGKCPTREALEERLQRVYGEQVEDYDELVEGTQGWLLTRETTEN